MFQEFSALANILQKIINAPTNEDRRELAKEGMQALAFYAERLEFQVTHAENASEKLAQQLATCQTERERLALALAKDESVRQGRETECRGGWFKRDPNDSKTWSKTVYCPICKFPASFHEQNWKFFCPRCNWESVFKSINIAEIIEELNLKRP